MPNPRRADVVRLTELNDLVEAVPYLLGFRPAESLVAVAMRGSRERLAFAMRVDLPPAGHEAAVVTAVTLAMERARADQVLLFVFTDEADGRDGLPRSELVDRLMAGVPLPVRDAVLVTDDRLWSYLCADRECCPPEGRVRDAGSSGALALAAVHAIHGTAVLPDRAAVVASVAPVEGPAAASMNAAVERAGDAYLRLGETALRDAAAALLAELVGRYADPPASVAHDEAALLVVASHEPAFRDVMVERCLADREPMAALLRDLARLVLPPIDAPLCTVLAVSAYLDGDGAVAGSALDRALSSDPDYTFARLVDSALRGQVSPADLRRVLSGTWPVRRRSRRRR